ncbi:MAG: hypothetical protein IH621_08865, partial [Krumholzibacteria bacterium]|nr:hypothetical protein [Candidatus Krumholzibacteria bacterium]
MTVLPVLFEDHTLACFRPVCWSLPVPEVRCGMFSLRERVGLLVPSGGALAVRTLLVPLNADPAWRPLAAAPPGPSLWLNGRLAPDFTLLAGLLEAADRGPFALTDAQGLLALGAGAELGAAVAASWHRWLAAAAP